MDTPTIRDYMTPLPTSVGREQTLAFARERMQHHGCRHLPVLHGGRLVGLLSERDISLVESLGNVDTAVVKVEEAMTQQPYAVAPETPLSDVALEMSERKYGAAVVMDGEHLHGIFTTTDAMAALAAILTLQSAPR